MNTFCLMMMMMSVFEDVIKTLRPTLHWHLSLDFRFHSLVFDPTGWICWLRLNIRGRIQRRFRLLVFGGCRLIRLHHNFSSWVFESYTRSFDRLTGFFLHLWQWLVSTERILVVYLSLRIMCLSWLLERSGLGLMSRCRRRLAST